MPDQSNNNQAQFEVITAGKSGKSGKKGFIITIIVIIFLGLSVVAGVLLVRQQQIFQEKAQVAACPAAEACPVAGQPDLLMSCAQSQAGEAPLEISCSSISNVGVIKSCGTRRFCCPSVGASWTTDVTLCSTATAAPTGSPTASPSTTPTATGSATPRGTATASATPRATSRAIPVTGTDWPTIAGGVVGVTVIILSILIAL